MFLVPLREAVQSSCENSRKIKQVGNDASWLKVQEMGEIWFLEFNLLFGNIELDKDSLTTCVLSSCSITQLN